MRLSLDEFHDALEQVHTMCRFSPNMIPMVSRGLVCAANIRSLPAPSPDISVEDFVLGMEALGVRFYRLDDDGRERLMRPVGFDVLPALWQPRAVALQDVFPASRNKEIGDFLRERDDPICQTAPTAKLAETPAAEQDAFVAALARYQEEVVAFDTAAGNLSDDECHAASDAINDRFFCEADRMPPAITSDAGAIAAVRQIFAEDVFIDTAMEKLLRAVLAYLEGRASA